MAAPSLSPETSPACAPCGAVSLFDAGSDEVARLTALHHTGLLDTAQEEAFDRLTRLAARLLDAPVALLSLVDRDRQFFKSAMGLAGARASIRQTPRSISFCQHVVARRAPLIIEDARSHPLVCDSPAIHELGVIAYLGIPIFAEGSQVIGSLCVSDAKPRAWTPEDVRTLEELSQITMHEIALRVKTREQATSLAALRESELRFSDAFAHAPIGMALVTPGGEWLQVNRALCEFVGYSEAELLTRNFQDFTHPGDVAAGGENVRRVLAGEASLFQMEKRYVHRGGHLVTALVSVSLVRDDTGQPGYLIAQIQDITERKRIAEELERTREQYAGLVNSMDGIVWEADAATFQFTFVSERAEHLLGFPTAQWLSVPGFWAGKIHPEDRDEAVAYCVGCTGRKENHTFEYRMVAADGRVVWMRDIVTYVEEPAKPAVLRGIMLDITESKRTEESLRLLGSAVEQAKDSILITDAGLDRPGPRIVFVNPAFTKMTGYTAEEVLGKTPRMLQGPRTDPAVLSRLRQNLGQGEVFAGETINYRRDGTEFDLEWQIAPLRDARGEITHFVAIQRDISERKRAEETLRESEEKFRELAENITDVFWISSPDMREMHYISPAYERIWGRSLAHLQTDPDQWIEAILPEEREPVFAAFAGLGADQLSVSVEYRISRPDGTIRWIHDRGFAVLDATGKMVRHTGIATDITERKQAESALRESQRFAESIAENSTSIIYLFDLETRTTVYSNRNAAEALGYSQAQIIEMGDNFLPTIIHPEDLPRVIQQQANFAEVKDDRVFDLELRVRSATGEWRWTWTRETVFKRRPNGAAWQVMGTAQDITERKQAEVSLKNAHKLLVTASRQAGMAEVATSVLHNVGNVLNSVNTSLSVAADKVGRLKSDGLSRIAALIEEHAENLPAFFAEHPQGVRLPKFLTQLAGHFAAEQRTVLRELASLRGNLEHINEIVAMQQSFTGAGGVVETLQLSEVIDDALRIHTASFERHGTRVACDLDPTLPPVPIDRHKLLLILVNLIRNAKHACDEAGATDKRITVRSYRNGGGAAGISVADNGIGISPENFTRIFEHGFTTRKSGHGFGLHSSALAASEMGGSLRVQSDGPGRGATFTIELPLAPTHS